MWGRPDNEGLGLQAQIFASDSDNETENVSLIGNCSENDLCCVDELTGMAGCLPQPPALPMHNMTT